MSLIPVTVLTGFLGSGKSTLLNALLKDPALADTAVLINEFGEVPVDHLLVREADDDITVLNSGCLCCTVRGDMVETMGDLFVKRVQGEVPEFRRMIIETTGLADPAPILHTLMSDPLVAARYKLDGIVTTIDAVHGMGQLDRQRECLKQVAVADRLVLTKLDLADPTVAEQLRARLRQLNPAAPIHVADHGRIDAALLLNAGLFNPGAKHPDVAGWLKEEAYEGHDHGHHHHHGHGHDHGHDPRHGLDVNRHDAEIGAFVVIFEAPVDWDALAGALELLAQTNGERLLRVKGIINAIGHERPLAIHGVQHLFHAPSELPAWPEGDSRHTRIVFITRDLEREDVAGLLNAVVNR
jgi:G3E family GTPase